MSPILQRTNLLYNHCKSEHSWIAAVSICVLFGSERPPLKVVARETTWSRRVFEAYTAVISCVLYKVNEGYVSLCVFPGNSPGLIREKHANLWPMAILGTLLFTLFFVLLAPKSRAMLGTVFTGAGDWVVKWAPYSYVLLLVVVFAPILASLVVIKWPEPPEPENPLARYKAEDVLED